MMVAPSDQLPRMIGRYALHREIAQGGMATIYLARLTGAVGFARTVAIKRLHAQFARNPDFVAMFVDEARLAARIHHPNVVSILDVLALEGELFLAMEYIQGESLSRLLRVLRSRNHRTHPRIATALLAGVLNGLHAAHEATDEQGERLNIVHRDVSPQNILVGADGVARVLDFGVAKAAGRLESTRDGSVKGKLAYMAPEQYARLKVDRRTDIFAASVVLWEILTGRRLFDGDNEAELVAQILLGSYPAPSTLVPTLPRPVDEVVVKGLARLPDERWNTAAEMAAALENAATPATPREVADFVKSLAGDALLQRSKLVAEVESSTTIKPFPVDSGSVPPTTVSAVSWPTPSYGQVPLPSPQPPQPPARSESSKVVLIVAMFVAALLIVLVAAILMLRPSATTASQVSAAQPSSLNTEGLASSAGPAPTIGIEAAPTVVLSTPPVLVTSPLRLAPTTGSSPSITPTAARSADKPPAPTTGKTQPPKPGCDPPYTVDSKGVRTYKSECL